MSVDVAAEREPDDDGVVLADLALSRSVTLQLTVVGVLGLLVSLGGFTGLYQAATGGRAITSFAPDLPWWNGALDTLVFILLGTTIIVPHEWIHGLAIRYYGGDVEYGVGVAHLVLPYAYATTDQSFSRNQFVVVALAPLVALTLVGVPVMLAFEWGWLVVRLAANAAGAVGDVWMALTVLGYPAHVRVTDHATGMAIVGREGNRPGRLSATGLLWDAMTGGAVAALVLVGLGGPVLLSALGVTSITVGTPDTITFLFSYTETPNSLSFAVGTGWTAVGGAVGIAYALVRNARRRGKVETAVGN